MIQEKQEKQTLILNRKRALEKDHQMKIEQQLSKQYSSTKSLRLNPLEHGNHTGEGNMGELSGSKRSQAFVTAHGEYQLGKKYP